MGFLRKKAASSAIISALRQISVSSRKAMRWTSRSSLIISNCKMPSETKKTATLATQSDHTDIFTARKRSCSSGEIPIARAFAGGLLFGRTGAFVGAPQRSRQKGKEGSKIVFIISYVTADGQEAFLPFEDTRLYKGPKVAAKLRELCGIERVQKQAAAASVTKL